MVLWVFLILKEELCRLLLLFELMFTLLFHLHFHGDVRNRKLGIYFSDSCILGSFLLNWSRGLKWGLK